MSSLQNINRSALIYPNAALVAPELECPICHDIMLIPIQCRRGHSVCSHCAHQVASAAGAVGAAGMAMCPSCRGPINLEDPTINFALQNMIDRVTCRCPNGTVAAGGGAAWDGDCTWHGTFDVLEAHLGVCSCVPSPCPFAPHGCTAFLPAAAMRVHHVERAAYHSALVADRFEVLEARIAEMESTLVDRLSETLADRMHEMTSTLMRVHVGEASATTRDRSVKLCSTLKARIDEVESTLKDRVESAERSSAAASTAVTALASAVPPRDWTVRWSIRAAPDKIARKASILSKRFTVQVPGRGTYIMQFKGIFTSSGAFGFYIIVLRDGCPAHAPAVDVNGTMVQIVREGYHANFERIFSGDATAINPGSTVGYDALCSDVAEYVQNGESIVINVTMKVQTEVVWV